jgi:hypothetical protein
MEDIGERTMKAVERFILGSLTLAVLLFAPIIPRGCEGDIVNFGVKLRNKPDYVQGMVSKSDLLNIADSTKPIDLNGDQIPELIVYKGNEKLTYKLDPESYCNQDVNCYQRIDGSTKRQ